MRIAVTGASGHIGNVVCRKLIEQGHEVRAFFRRDTRALADLNCIKIQGDILNQSDVARLVDGCEVVIHAAAIISIHGDPTGIVYQTNTKGPENVLHCCIKAGVKKIIHISSSHAVQEHPHDQALDESRAYKQSSDFAYDYSKAVGEQIMLNGFRSGQINGCVLRPSSVVGVHDYKPSEMGKALIDFYRRKIRILPQGGYDMVDVRDVANSIVRAIEKGRSGEIYFVCGVYKTIKQIAETVHKVANVKVPKSVMPFWVLRILLPFVKLYGKVTKAAPLYTIESISALKNGHTNMRSEKAIKELGHQVRPFEETVRDFYDWQIEKGVLS